jgi:hypothetical protein
MGAALALGGSAGTCDCEVPCVICRFKAASMPSLPASLPTCCSQSRMTVRWTRLFALMFSRVPWRKPADDQRRSEKAELAGIERRRHSNGRSTSSNSGLDARKPRQNKKGSLNLFSSPGGGFAQRLECSGLSNRLRTRFSARSSCAANIARELFPSFAVHE